MFRIICDPSTRSAERAWLKILVIFFMCLVGVWRHSFEPAVCVHGTCTHTAGSKLCRQTPTKHTKNITSNFSQAHSALPDDGFANDSKHVGVTFNCLLKLIQCRFWVLYNWVHELANKSDWSQFLIRNIQFNKIIDSVIIELSKTLCAVLCFCQYQLFSLAVMFSLFVKYVHCLVVATHLCEHLFPLMKHNNNIERLQLTDTHLSLIIKVTATQILNVILIG